MEFTNINLSKEEIEKLEVFLIVRAVIGEVISDEERITCNEGLSYFSIFIDTNLNPVCRLYFNMADGVKGIGLLDANGKIEYKNMEKWEEIRTTHKKQLLETASKYK